jgi:hypothetical protein
VVYKKGSENAVADALSRRNHGDVLAAISAVQHNWLSDVVTGYDSDLAAQALLTQVALHPDAQPPFTLVQSVIRYKGRIWLGSNK